jgi:hypothetical protein
MQRDVFSLKKSRDLTTPLFMGFLIARLSFKIIRIRIAVFSFSRRKDPERRRLPVVLFDPSERRLEQPWAEWRHHSRVVKCLPGQWRERWCWGHLERCDLQGRWPLRRGRQRAAGQCPPVLAMRRILPFVLRPFGE